MPTNIPLLNQGPKFSREEATQIKKQFWKDKEFQKMYIKIQNAWLLQKIPAEKAVEYIKTELEKSLKK